MSTLIEQLEHEVEYNNQIINASLPYIEIAEKLKELDPLQQYELIKKVEAYFDDQSETELGDFLNDMAYLYLTEITNPEINNMIVNLIIDSELNFEMVSCVGETICDF